MQNLFRRLITRAEFEIQNPKILLVGAGDYEKAALLALYPEHELVELDYSEALADLEGYEKYFNIILAPYCYGSERIDKTLYKLAMLLAPYGILLSAFGNLRYYQVLEGLKQGEFGYNVKRLFTQKDFARLMGECYYHYYDYEPISAGVSEGELRAYQDYAYPEELGVQSYYFLGMRYPIEIMKLRKEYTPSVRHRLSYLVKSIEAGIMPLENQRKLAELMQAEGITDSYLEEFMVHNLADLSKFIINLQEDREPKYRIRDYLRANFLPPPEKMFSFIICVNNETEFHENAESILNLRLPEGFGAEIIPIYNAKSMCSGYNLGQDKARGKYKIYTHQDVFFYSDTVLMEVLAIFADSTIGMVGAIGARKLHPSGVWYKSHDITGGVLQQWEDGGLKNSKRKYRGDMDSKALDGLLLITQYDLRWREDLFTGWHFYDISMCLEMQRKGYRTVAAGQSEYWCIHCLKDKPLDDSYEQYRLIFLREYDGEF